MVQFNHISIGSSNPEKAAKAMAKLTGGQMGLFPPVKGGYYCQWGTRGEMIEFYPREIHLTPSDHGCEFTSENLPKLRTSSVHLNLDVDLDSKEVKALCEEFGYPFFFRPKHGGPLYEVWIEGEFLLELVTSDLQK